MGANFVRSVLAASVAAVTVGASALSMPPAPPASERGNILEATAFSLTAVSKPLPPVAAVPIGLGSLEPEVVEFVESTSINSAIKNIYNAVEPWVAWGFEVAQYVVGWIPIAGYFAPQITILYNFGESIVQSIVFNLDDWIFGPLPFFDGLRNVISDTWDASWNLLWNEIDWLLPPLPPLPPIPPCPSWLCGGAVAEATLAAAPDAELSAQPWDSVVSLLKFQADAAQGLSQSVGEALALFAKDLLATGGQAISDFFEHGLITAAANALKATWESFVLRSEQAADGFAEYVDAQHDYFSGQSTADAASKVDSGDDAVDTAAIESDSTGDDSEAAADDTEADSTDGSSEPTTSDEDAELGEDLGESDGLGDDDGETTPPTVDPADDDTEQEDAAEPPSDPDTGEADDSGNDDAGAGDPEA